ncbi:hypothetical protein NEFER03_1557 [Nematocida sp. LUAm3]|nr:hypothetical protein NEFER03_1557 [Nematocida sp. LUAm3]KAI5174590.1 hypothetical protein NEFER02_0711 [Nematocida sp. LUAm2]KAI5178004.1 hypothetical protein NEFER01_1186 [Nematocida sp. LUAm1]
MSAVEEEFIETEEIKRSRPTEGILVLQMQAEAAEKLKSVKTRHFELKKVPITTIGGSKLWTNRWTSSSPPLNTTNSPVEKEKNICDVCSREFLDKRRLAIHKNVHLKDTKQ